MSTSNTANSALTLTDEQDEAMKQFCRHMFANKDGAVNFYLWLKTLKEQLSPNDFGHLVSILTIYAEAHVKLENLVQQDNVENKVLLRDVFYKLVENVPISFGLDDVKVLPRIAGELTRLLNIRPTQQAHQTNAPPQPGAQIPVAQGPTPPVGFANIPSADDMDVSTIMSTMDYGTFTLENCVSITEVRKAVGVELSEKTFLGRNPSTHKNFFIGVLAALSRLKFDQNPHLYYPLHPKSRRIAKPNVGSKHLKWLIHFYLFFGPEKRREYNEAQDRGVVVQFQDFRDGIAGVIDRYGGPRT